MALAEGKEPPYHHGDLRNALVAAATQLAKEAGPSAIVLREAARRVGVSANAAYRHFTSLPDLVAAVAFDALVALARSMQAELAKCQPSGDAGRDSINRLGAVGRGYVHFAITEPGLFATAFSQPKVAHTGDTPGRRLADKLAQHAEVSSGLMPYELLEQALDGMVVAGVLDPADRAMAATNAWAAVHGLSGLLLGPLAGQSPAAREELIGACLELVGRGLITRKGPASATAH